MKTTLEKYKKLRDMDLIDGSKYDINARAEMIVREVQQQIQKWEDEARAIYFPESKKENKQ